MPLYAYHARYRVAEPDFEIGQERKCLRSHGHGRETSFSRSRSRGGMAPRPADCREPYRQFECRCVFLRYQRLAGGGGGIRTHGTLARTTVFEIEVHCVAPYRPGLTDTVLSRQSRTYVPSRSVPSHFVLARSFANRFARGGREIGAGPNTMQYLRSRLSLKF